MDFEKVEIEDGDTIVDALVKSKICKSRSEAKRLIKQGAVRTWESEESFWKHHPL